MGSPYYTYTAYVSKTSNRRLPDLRDLRRLCRTRVPRTRYVPRAADGQSDALAVARVDQPAAHPVLAHRSAHAPRPLDHLPARAPPLPLAHLLPRRTTCGAQQRRPARSPAHALAAVAPAPRAGVRAVPPHPCAVSAPSGTRYARTRAGSVPSAASDCTAAGGTATAAKAARKARTTAAAERAAGTAATATTTATTAGAARARAAATATTASLPVPSRRPVCPPPLV